MRSLRNHLTYANVMSTLAALFALTGGVAYAANTIASSDIIDGEVKTQDLAANAVNSSKISDGQVTEADIGQGAVNTAELKNDVVTGQKVANESLNGNDVVNNALKGADIDEETLDIGNAARAYARVDPGSCTGTPGTCSFEESKGISSVTREDVGNYCVTAPGIDRLGTPAAVTVDSARTGAAGQTSATTHEGPIPGFGPCTQGGFGVITERQQLRSVDAGGQTNNAFVSEQARSTNDVAFTIVIP